MEGQRCRDTKLAGPKPACGRYKMEGYFPYTPGLGATYASGLGIEPKRSYMP